MLSTPDVPSTLIVIFLFVPSDINPLRSSSQVSDRRWGTDVSEIEIVGSRLTTLVTSLEEALHDAIDDPSKTALTRPKLASTSPSSSSSSMESMAAHRRRMMMMPYPSEWHGHPPDNDGMGGIAGRFALRQARSSNPSGRGYGAQVLEQYTLLGLVLGL